jgi:hypothetical protein
MATVSGDSAIERSMRAQDAARMRAQDELERCEYRIAELEGNIQQKDAEIAQLAEWTEKNKSEEQMDAVAQKNESDEKHPSQIAPEAALDTIIRLENTLKLAQRRNVQFEKELSVRHRVLKDRTKALDAQRKNHTDLVSVTGYSADMKTEDVHKLREDIEEMERLETTLTEEAKTARVIIRKKQQLVDTLIAELENKKQLEEALYALYNDIRVKDRDVHQAEATLEELKRQDKKRNTALAAAEDRRDTVALNCLEKDKEFLRREVQHARDHHRQQEATQKKQIHRQLQLQSRLEMIQEAVRDIGWEAELNATLNANQGLVIADTVGEPDDEDRIFPPNETISAEVYELLRTNFETVSTALSRKDILLLEKDAAIKSLEDKVLKATLLHNSEARQQVVEDRKREEELAEQQQKLADRLADYRAQIEALTRKNLKLRAQIEKATKQA